MKSRCIPEAPRQYSFSRYLCLQLLNQPNLTTTVKADLPDETYIVLSMPMDEFVIHMSVTSACKSTTCGTTSTKKKAMSTE